MMIEPVAEAAKSFGIFSSLERATEGTSFFLLIAFTLTMDCGLLHVYKVGLFQISGMPELVKPQLAVNAVVLFILFSGFMTFVMPIIAVLAYDLIIYTVYGLWLKLRGWLLSELFSDPSMVSHRAPGFVSLFQLEEKAYATTGNSFIWCFIAVLAFITYRPMFREDDG